MINGLTNYLTLDGTDLSYVFLSGTTITKSGYLLSDGRTDLSDIFASKSANTANITGYKYISAGIENDINQLYAKIQTFGVTFDIALDSQFFKQTTTDGLYDVYTIVGQSGTDATTYATWVDKSVVATFTTIIAKTIYYVCVGGGGWTYIPGTASCGGGGAGAYYEGSFNITSDVSFNFTAGGSYKTSTIKSSIISTITAGYGGYVDRSISKSDNGINGSSGGGSSGGNNLTDTRGTGSSPGNNGGGGTFSNNASGRSGGGGGGAGSIGGNGTVGGNGSVGGNGGSGKTPTSTGIKNFYTTPLCVGGGGYGTFSTGSSSTTYGSGATARPPLDSTYRYGQPGAIIIAVPKT